MGGEPFSDLTNAKFSLGNGFGDEFVRSNGLKLEIVAVDAEKCIRSSQLILLFPSRKAWLLARDSIKAAAS